MAGMFRSTEILSKAIDASWKRNEVINNNLANVDTPGYKRQAVEFESFLSAALDNKKFEGKRTNEKHIPIGSTDTSQIPIVTRQDRTSNEMRLDGNNVDIDEEMSQLSKNNIYYNAIVQQISKQFNMIKSAIKDTK